MGKTLDLARQQGLVKTRKFNNIFKKQENGASKKQVFTHFMVIDFEATCWERKPGPPSEIIEFPAVMLNAKSKEILDNTFHYYVQPTEEPNLSEFCKELTGIDQEKVENAAPLGSTLMLFNKWIRNNFSQLSFNVFAEDNNCAVVTWTDWDMKICLENECKRKNIRFPTHLKSWIDLKYVYKKFYQRQPKGLNGALQEMGLNFEGREHSGVCDAKNTAKLLLKMTDDGCVLGLTKSLNPGPLDERISFDNQTNLVSDN